MKIEVGKFYKTRDGRKARIYATDGPMGSSVELHGAVEVDDGWAARAWWLSGYYTSSEVSHPEDLISEWSEPKLRPWKPEGVPVGAVLQRKRSAPARWVILGCFGEGTISYLDVMGVFNRLTLNEIASVEFHHSINGGKTWHPCGVMEGGE